MAWAGSTRGWRPCGSLVPPIPGSIAGSRRGRDNPGGHGRSRSRVPVSGRWSELGPGRPRSPLTALVAAEFDYSQPFEVDSGRAAVICRVAAGQRVSSCTADVVTAELGSPGQERGLDPSAWSSIGCRCQSATAVRCRARKRSRHLNVHADYAGLPASHRPRQSDSSGVAGQSSSRAPVTATCRASASVGSEGSLPVSCATRARRYVTARTDR
jgi:hypothetical protein